MLQCLTAPNGVKRGTFHAQFCHGTYCSQPSINDSNLYEDADDNDNDNDSKIENITVVEEANDDNGNSAKSCQNAKATMTWSKQNA